MTKLGFVGVVVKLHKDAMKGKKASGAEAGFEPNLLGIEALYQKWNAGQRVTEHLRELNPPPISNGISGP